MAARRMETTTMMIGLVVTLLASTQAAAQSNGCSSVMMTLSPCLDFISSKSPVPGISCCSLLTDIIQSDPRCLCMVLDGSATSFGISINQTRAMELPGVCKVQAPSISQCTGVSGQLATTAPTPSSEPVATEEEAAEAAADAPSGNTTSSSTNSKNAANLMATMLIPACALLYVF
ncbi:non-specific lipid transfer protein GPI-anchored 5-like [Phragmites australis]|uniref:non-specific lipid transfer protein GPI-anchored 5-like n=1 Tax=Phragmites australis TaxID=29695 RepID=UPI002D7A2F8A|nr:non-specific lipid transfer protein GPI-anchored 5-like [Phragmites australis]